MDPDLLTALSKQMDSHTGHAIGLVALWIVRGAVNTVKEVLSEIREMKQSMVLLNQQMAIVVSKVTDHDERLHSLESKK
jgi:uncharacterized protein YoxC